MDEKQGEEKQDIVVWGDNEERIKTIQGWFGPGSEPLLKSGRILVGEGVLLKQCRKKLKPRQFFLFNDILVYANIIVSRKRYNKQRILKLSEISVEESADEKAMQILAPGRSFLVITATADEAKEWIFHIKMCINNLPEKPAMKPPSAAVWVPDKAAEKCMICSAKFTTFNRRHHCRKCGKVVCGNCSSKKWDLPAISNKASRVCDSCFDGLSKGNMSATEIITIKEGSNAGKDFESEDELQNTPAPQATNQKGGDSDSDEEDGNVRAKMADLTMDKGAEGVFQQNVRASMFFTNEDDKTNNDRFSYQNQN